MGTRRTASFFPVTSSWIKSISYVRLAKEYKDVVNLVPSAPRDKYDGFLIVETAQAAYAYLVPSWLVGLVLASESKGKAFDRRIKGQYRSLKLPFLGASFPAAKPQDWNKVILAALDHGVSQAKGEQLPLPAVPDVNPLTDLTDLTDTSADCTGTDDNPELTAAISAQG